MSGSPEGTEEWKQAAARDVEAWQREKMKEFEEQWKRTQQMRLQSLEHLWAQEKGALVRGLEDQQRVLSQLETQLRSKLKASEASEAAIRKRRQAIAQEGRELEFRKKKQQTLYEEARDKATRMVTTLKAEHQQRLEAVRRLVQDLRRQNEQLNARLQQQTQAHHHLDRDFRKYRAQVASTPSGKLRSLMRALEAEKQDLEQRLAKEREEKQAWKRKHQAACQELEQVRKDVEGERLSWLEAHRAALSRWQFMVQQQNLASSKLRETSQLACIKREIQDLLGSEVQ